MDKQNATRWAAVLAIAVAIAMMLPTMATMGGDNATIAAAGPTELVWVSWENPNEANGLMKQMGLNAVSQQKYGAYLRVTEAQKAALSERNYINEMPDRTKITLLEQGISFDSKVGYDLPEEWTNPDTNTYMVQFILPAEKAWVDEVATNSGGILKHIGDNVVVVKMTPAQKAKITALDTVEWIGAYEPGFKMQAGLAEKTDIIRVEVIAFPGVSEQLLKHYLIQMGAWVGDGTDVMDTTGTTGYGSMVCDIDASKLSQVARSEDVEYIQFVAEPKIFNQVGGRISKAHDLWDNRISNLGSNLQGEGQIVHVQDTGLDATIRDFTSGPLGNRILFAESLTDADGHGTHVSGTVLGNGYNMELFLGLPVDDRVYNTLAATNPVNKHDRMGFAGRAPEATLYHRAGLGYTEWAAGYTAGARIFSNSWGTSNWGYNRAGDDFAVSNSGAVVVFAAGNEGPAKFTQNEYANGKLVVAVGARENQRSDSFEDGSDDFQEVVEFSSRGPPVGELRIKPDILEVGSYVYSTKSDDVSEAAYPGLYDLITLIDEDNDNVADYCWMFGTSMATPAASGDLALIRDYLVDVKSIANPHANLLKMLLIHGAEDLGYGYPSYDQGWGGVNVRNSVAPPAPNTLQWRHLTSVSGTWNAEDDGGMDLTVIDSTVPLKFTMVHWDTSGSGTLTTDYDLVVTSPDGTRYEGNAFREGWSMAVTSPTSWNNAKFPSWMGNDAYDFDTANDGGDDVNNVEMVRIENPLKGTWKAEIVTKSGGNVVSFAITGGMDPASDVNANQYKISMQLDYPRIVMERDGMGESVYRGSPGSTTSVGYWLNNGGTSSSNFIMSNTLPAGFSVSFTSSTPSLTAGERAHYYANIEVGGSVAVGTYTCQLSVTSTSDSTNPIAQSVVSFQVDVIDTVLPETWNAAGSPVHESHAAPVYWSEASDGNKPYVGLAYRQSEQFGSRVYFVLSKDGGITWETPIPIGPRSYYPGWVTIDKGTDGVMIAYNAYNPAYAATYTTDGNQVRIAYAAYPYTSFSDVGAFTLGEGPQVRVGGKYVTANSYRTINVIHSTIGNTWHLIIEAFGYDAKIDGNQVGIYCIGKTSTNNGATWSAWTRLDPAVAGMFYFFPHPSKDVNGQIGMWFYERDSGDAAQDRDAAFRRWNGAWQALIVSWDTEDNLMMPMGISTAANTWYGMYLKGANTDGDRQFFVHYTTDGGLTFNNNGGAGFGPLGYGIVASDHSYGVRTCSDLSYTSDGYLWATYFRHQAYDPYGQPNILSCYDVPTSMDIASKTYYLTSDCLPKNKVAVTEVGTYNLGFYDTWSKDGNVNIKVSKYFHDWDLVPDVLGPNTYDVTTDKQNVIAGEIVTVTANIDDWETGGSNIQTAVYRYDDSTTNVTMQPTDGAWSSPLEAVISSTTKIDTTGWIAGDHTIYVAGRDVEGNWGDWESCILFVDTPNGAPNPPTNPIPVDDAIGIGTSPTLQVSVSDPELNPMTVVFYNAANPSTPLGTVNNVASGTTTSIIWPGLSIGTEYSWYATANDGTFTTQSPTWSFTTGGGANVAPNAPVNPSPSSGSTGVSTSPTLAVDVSDPDGDAMTVTFYNAAGPSQIGQFTDVPSGQRVMCDWIGLSEGVTYSWYVTAKDSLLTTQSATWTFTTADSTPPANVTDLTVDHYGQVVVNTVYDYTETTTSGPHFARFIIVDEASSAEFNTPNQIQDFTDQNYIDISTSNNVYAQHLTDPPNFDEGATEYRYQITEDPNLIDQITIKHEARYDGQTIVSMYVKNDANNWDLIGTSLTFTNLGEQTMTRVLDTNIPNYIDADGKLWVIFYGAARTQVQVDYAEIAVNGMVISDLDNTLNWTHSGADVSQYCVYRSDSSSGPWEVPYAFVSVGDNTYVDVGAGTGDTTIWWYVVRAQDGTGNEEENTNAVPEPGAVLAPYDITIPGATGARNDWVFVSFAYAFSGNIQDILDDSVYGGSG
ncbi:MAG: S8 family serine peptidase, partial [Thermoplasmata archaeon]